MAERRMFAKSIINSARFLRMPQTSRLLYYDLGMAADDDGIVEAFTVIRTTGAAEDDLRVLATRGFVSVLNEDLVSYIKDWGTNNQIRKDRYRPSIYEELLVKIESRNQAEPNWQPDGNQRETQVSLGKASTVKFRPNKESGSAAAPRPTPAPPETNFGPELQAAFDRWLAYKKERRETYKPTGLSALVTQIQRNAAQYGEKAVAELIESCMANGWRGIIWDKLGEAEQNKKQSGNPFAELARKEGLF